MYSVLSWQICSGTLPRFRSISRTIARVIGRPQRRYYTVNIRRISMTDLYIVLASINGMGRIVAHADTTFCVGCHKKVAYSLTLPNKVVQTVRLYRSFHVCGEAHRLTYLTHMWNRRFCGLSYSLDERFQTYSIEIFKYGNEYFADRRMYYYIGQYGN